MLTQPKDNNQPGNDNTVCVVRDLGITNFQETDSLMKNLTRLRQEEQIQDQLLLTAHYPCLTLGARPLNPDDLIKPLASFEREGIPLFKATRGGGLAFHWPGQVNCYPILKLQPHEQHISKYMYGLEEVGLRTLNDLGIAAYRQRDTTTQIGLWFENKKISIFSIFYVKRWSATPLCVA